MKIYFFATGMSSIPLGLFVKGEAWKRIHFPILNFMVEYDDGLLLFDTGLGSTLKQDMKSARYRGQWFFNKWVMQTSYQPHNTLQTKITKLGFTLSDVKYVILSHLHWDHAGGMRDFPNAKFIINKREWEAATEANAYRHAYIPEQYERKNGLDIKLVSTVPGRSFLGFPDSLDLFDDGRFTLVDLPGHTRGAWGLFVDLPSERRFFFVGDAYYFPESIEKVAPKSRLMQLLVGEDPLAMKTLGILHNLARNQPDLEIIGSHDHRIPGRYNLAPEYYE